MSCAASSRSRSCPRQTSRAAALVEEAGGRAWATDEAETRLEAALAELGLAEIPEEARDEPESLARFIVAREF